MDKLANYRDLVKQFVREHADQPQDRDNGIECEAVIDEALDHYELMNVGWKDERRIHGCLLHVDIRNGKIWIQHDGIERCLADWLVEAGVPKSDIVLGFHSPFKRKFTEFAVG